MNLFASQALIVALLGNLCFPTLGQESEHSRHMAVNSVGESRVVSIEITITNDLDSQIVLPSCGQLLKKQVVCFPPAFFEQYDGSAWKRVQDKDDHLFGEFATPPLVTIDPHASIEVHAAFPPDTYKWEAGQPVRLVIPTWPVADKARAPGNRIRNVTGPLQPPSAGRTAFLPQ